MRAAADPSLAAVRAELLIGGIEVLPSEAYERIGEIETTSVERFGYAELSPAWPAAARDTAAGIYFAFKLRLPLRRRIGL